MCRDYNPKQSECSIALCRLYITIGQIDPALEEIKLVLMQKKEDRLMLTTLKQWDCTVPSMVLDLFTLKAEIYGISSEEAMLYFLMVSNTIKSGTRLFLLRF